MLLYRITLSKYANILQASGRAARWNSNDMNVIYTSSSKSLACLENVVHRNQLGLNQQFKVLTVYVPDQANINEISMNKLGTNWQLFEHMIVTQQIGDNWIKGAQSLLLKVPSSIIKGEFNFLINPAHPSFMDVELVKIENFEFDERIKR